MTDNFDTYEHLERYARRCADKFIFPRFTDLVEPHMVDNVYEPIVNEIKNAGKYVTYKRFLPKLRQTIRWHLINRLSQYDFDYTIRSEQFTFDNPSPLFTNFEDLEYMDDVYNEISSVDRAFVDTLIREIKHHECIIYRPEDITSICIADFDEPMTHFTMVLEFFETEEYTFEVVKSETGWNVECTNVRLDY